MSKGSSRRTFLTTGLAAVPTAAITSRINPAFSQTASAQPAGLQYRVLGRTGLKVTTVGFGCMITSDPAVIQKAADLGINYFDTARGYQGGNNEKMVGAALKAKRKSIVLSSKTPSGTKEGALADLDESLRQLQTDYLDIWYLHGRSKAEEISDGFLEAQRIAKKAGKIRFSGVSTHSGMAEVIRTMIAKKADLDVVLTSYNFSMDPSIEESIESAAKAGLGVVAMKVMAGGFRRVREGDKLRETLSREGAMLAALKWVIRNENIHTTIPSITDMEQLEENMRAMTLPFDESDKQLLASQLDLIGPLYCRSCGQCRDSCAKGLPVSDILRYLSYAEGYGQFRLAREEYLRLPQEILQQRCALCPECTVNCPKGVHVAERLRVAQEMLA
ncbi:MAG TPA: aldo/keto reductase [Acidobacteriota bacterium]|nr:aldo/keto reductase [Acidobacteriota bacterium]